MRVLKREQMRQVERNSLQYDLTSQRLMENAGAAAAAYIRRTFRIESRNCIVFCSRGNNGGDGFVVARKLSESDANVVVVLVDGPPAGGEALEMFNALGPLELPILSFAPNAGRISSYLRQTDLVVDAISGTGFLGSLRETHRNACELINDCNAVVVSLDIPTGVECDSGNASEGAIRADYTLSFDSLKPAHILPASIPYCGQIEVLDIGIPPQAHDGVPNTSGSYTLERVFEFLPKRAPESHKGSYGKLVNIAGSAQYRGAAILSTMAALRCGAGLVTLCSTETVCAAAAVRAPEAVFLPMEQNEIGTLDGTLPLTALTERLESASAVAFGCGLGNNLHTSRLLEHVLKRTSCPLVIDADGINALAGNIHVLKRAKGPLVITPHPGEMARLCGVTVEQVQEDRIGTAMGFARRNNVLVVLKGHKTIIATPDGELLINETGNAGLARGGSGDVLTGMIGAFLAQGLPYVAAAACGVFLHGMAADRAAARLSQTAMLPGDLLDDLAGIFLEQGR